MQKALDNILRHYLRQETSEQYGKAPVAVDGQGFKIEDFPTVEQEDEELLRSLYQCLEEKGVLRELQAFLRQRLVSVLQGTWPQLFEHSRTDKELNPLAISLMEDFLCSHKLLFTFSVLATELGDDFEQKTDFGKLASARAECVLEELGIPKDSVRSRNILDRYTQNGTASLLESILSVSGGFYIPEETAYNISKDHKYQYKNDLSLNEKLKNIDDKYAGGRKRSNKNNVHFAGDETMDARFRALAMTLERDKQIQLQLAIDRFKEEEYEKLKDQIETKLKFELLKKEKELLSNYEEKVNHMKNNLDREKELWISEKQQKERELLERRDELVEAIQSIREEQRKGGLEAHGDGGSNHLSANVDRSDSSKCRSNTDENILNQDTRSMEVYSGDREAKRYFLLQEAKLRNTIDKLSRENQELKSAKPVVVNQEVQNSEPVTPPRRKPIPEPKSRPPRRQPHVQDTDTIAFLQYQLEKQAEEIEELRKTKQDENRFEIQIPTKISSKGSKVIRDIPEALQTTDLEGFLVEAKKRMADIERDAARIGTTLTKFNENRMGVKPSLIQQTTSDPPLFQFPEDNLKKPVQPRIPKSVFAPIPVDLNEFPSYLKPGIRHSKTDFSIPFVPSKINFATSYSDEYRNAELFRAASIPPNKNNKHFISKSSEPSAGNSKSEVETETKSDPHSQTISSSNKLDKMDQDLVSPGANIALNSKNQSDEPKRKPSKSRSTSSSSSRPSTEKARALILEKVLPSDVPAATDGNATERSISLNSSKSVGQKIRKAIESAVAEKASTKTPVVKGGSGLGLLKSLGLNYSPENMSSNSTDADEMNVYEEGRIESGTTRLDDDFFS